MEKVGRTCIRKLVLGECKKKYIIIWRHWNLDSNPYKKKQNTNMNVHILINKKESIYIIIKTK